MEDPSIHSFHVEEVFLGFSSLPSRHQYHQKVSQFRGKQTSDLGQGLEYVSGPKVQVLVFSHSARNAMHLFNNVIGVTSEARKPLNLLGLSSIALCTSDFAARN